jgi:hypothetical protein
MIEKFARVVMVGLVPTIQPSVGSDACGTVDPRDKPEDDTHVWRRGLASLAIGTLK